MTIKLSDRFHSSVSSISDLISEMEDRNELYDRNGEMTEAGKLLTEARDKLTAVANRGISSNKPEREVTPLSGFSINVPEWFEDKAFISWLNDPGNTIFTWHKRGEEASDWSDVMVCVDPSLSGEGSESDMPGHIWDQIVALCKKHFRPATGSHIHVRLTNLS